MRQVRANTSPHHVPKVIVAVPDIPRTISGKITELAVRDVIHGRPVKNTDALANPGRSSTFATGRSPTRIAAARELAVGDALAHALRHALDRGAQHLFP
ncbi:MAG: hypothetical protein IPN47_10500 [Gemmatimonadetes bacterium]|nr:hypothetical protein [Gemmatimonadota bacterium]